MLPLFLLLFSIGFVYEYLVFILVLGDFDFFFIAWQLWSIFSKAELF